MENATVVKNTYGSAFLLDKSKISRMINIIEEKNKSLNLSSNYLFDITLKNGKKVSLTTLDELFRIDNTIRNPISSLVIEIESMGSELIKNIKTGINYSDSKKENILIKVESTDSGLALQLFAELEEQIERTLLKDLVYRLFKKDSLFSSLAAILGLLSALFALIFATNDITAFGIQKSAANNLIEEYSMPITQEEKIDFLYEYSMEQLKSIDANKNIDVNLEKIINRQTIFILLPIVIVIVLIIYLILECYPVNNFVWGDYEEYYSKIKSRRATIWNIIFISIGIGIIINLFGISISGYLNLDH